MKVLRVDYKADNAAKQFTQSLKETGFGVLTNHNIDMDLVNRVYQKWAEFYASDDKNNYLYTLIHPKDQAGFFPMDQAEIAKGFAQPDIKEYYHVYPWAKLPAFLAEETLQLRKDLTLLAIQLLTWIEENTPEDIRTTLSMPLSDMIKESKRTLFRILHYPPLLDEVQPGAIRAAEHGDICLLTILPAATDSGLQVKNAQGEWYEVPTCPNSLVINVGDMLEMATKGHYVSTLHRVMNPEGDAAKRSRLSMPLFLHPRDEVRLSDSYLAHDFLLERLKENGVIDKATESLSEPGI